MLNSRQNIDSQGESRDHGSKTTITTKATEKPAENRVGEPWPPLLSKQFLAIYFGYWSKASGRICTKGFRNKVLTPEVLQMAGIDQKYAYSRNCKTFNAMESISLTKILRGFCLVSFLITSTIMGAQTSAPAVKYSGDKFINDTIPGVAVISDSTIRMVRSGTMFEYQEVLSTIVVDAYMVKEYRFLVRASDGGTEPFDMVQRFHLRNGGLLDPKRILMFKSNEK